MRVTSSGVAQDHLGYNDDMALLGTNQNLWRVIRLVAILNLAYFGIEFAVARAIGSVSLFADSIDFLEDASVNILILVALGWVARKRARVGMLLACYRARAGFRHALDSMGKIQCACRP